MDDKLIRVFYDLYTDRQNTMYRLPVDTDINEFWPEEIQYRIERSEFLPLHSYDGHAYRFVKTNKFIEAANKITEMARCSLTASVFSDLSSDSMIDEAFFSSVIEGAYSTRENAREFIESGAEPADKSEQMILNNYNALRFVTDNLEYPVTEEMIVRLGEILTCRTLKEGDMPGIRDSSVRVISHTGETVYIAPDACYVRPMLQELISYINDPEVHPVTKAAVVHVYFVTVHPFVDGNGRTARALAYMILLKAGYDFFRYVPISGILAQERSKYYRALRSSQSPANGYDFTYFTDYYTDLLARTLESVKNHIQAMDRYRSAKAKLDPDRDARAVKGALWMANDDIASITAKKWQSKFKVSFETARKDLNTLEKAGFLTKRTEGHKVYFDLKL